MEIPNSIVFNLWPLLDPYQKAVYIELYKWTFGFGRASHVFPQQHLSRALKMSDRKLTKTLIDLENIGLCKRAGYDNRGLRVEVYQPTINTPERRSRPEPRSTPERRSRPEPSSPLEKDMKENRKPLNVYEIRAKAVRLREVLASSGELTADRLRSGIRAALVIEGLDATDMAIEEAIAPMLPSE